MVKVEQGSTADQAPVVIEAWADLGCPWCYVGKHRLQRAIAARSDAGRFEMKIRSFEPNPDSPTEPEPIAAVFMRKHGGDPSVVLEAENRIQAIARREGLEFDLDRKNVNTFDLHRVMHYAEQSGKGLEFFSQIQDRFFAGEIDPYAPDAMVEVAQALGLNGDRVREVLATDEFADDVRADAAQWLAFGAQGVPFTVFGRRIAASGAQAVAAYGQALDQALEAIASEEVSA